MTDEKRSPRTIRFPVPFTPGALLPSGFTLEVPAPNVGHPGLGESLIPFWGSGREALADYYDGSYGQALANTALAATDVFLVKAAAEAGLKGGFKLGEASWKATRARLTRDGFAKPGQPVHHVFIPQGGWGRRVPGAIKHATPNLKPMPDAVVHGRLHGPYKGAPQYGPLQQFFVGTTAGQNLAIGDAAGHATATVADPRGEPR